MLTDAITVTSGVSITLVASSRPPRPTSSSTTSAGCCANSQNAAAVSISKMVIGAPALACSQCSNAVLNSSSLTSVPPPAPTRAQERCVRPFALGAGAENHGRQFALGMVEPLQQPLHPLQTEIDAPG